MVTPSAVPSLVQAKTAQDKAGDYTQAAKDKAGDLSGSTKDTAGKTQDTAGDYAQTAKDKASSAADTLGSKVCLLCDADLESLVYVHIHHAVIVAITCLTRLLFTGRLQLIGVRATWIYTIFCLCLVCSGADCSEDQGQQTSPMLAASCTGL